MLSSCIKARGHRCIEMVKCFLDSAVHFRESIVAMVSGSYTCRRLCQTLIELLWRCDVIHLESGDSAVCTTSVNPTIFAIEGTMGSA